MLIVTNFPIAELWGRSTTVPWAVIFPQAPLVNRQQVPRHPSQLYAAGIEGILVFLIAQRAFERSSRPGFTTATVLVAYGIGRFIDEFWRQPDVGQPVYWGWMSKGQLLTIPMIVLGILWLLQCKRSAAIRT
jgi:phosphatidylglycerol:prolipoprotein diacylglycerol transferase